MLLDSRTPCSNDFYNAACAGARLGKSEAAYSYLFKAIEAGFLEKDLLTKDPDLETLRPGGRWQAIMDSVQQRMESVERTFPETRVAGPVIDLSAPRFDGTVSKEVSEASFNQDQFKTASAAIVYSAVYERTTKKYGQRGRDRYVCMDLGHSAENVYLQAYALKIGTCAIGAFTDLWLKRAVGMTREEEPPYIMPRLDWGVRSIEHMR